MQIKRDRYLQQIIDYMWDGQVKVITGIRRCGKSYLLNILFKNYLFEQGVARDKIISVELDLTKFIKYRNPLALAEYVRSKVEREEVSGQLLDLLCSLVVSLTNPKKIADTIMTAEC